MSVHRIDRRGRVALLVGAGLLYVVVLAIGIAVAHRGTPLGFDIDAYRVLRPVRFVSRFVELGSARAVVTLCLALAAFALARRDILGGVVCVVAPLLAEVLTQAVAKPLVGRRLPWIANVYPSGHVTGVAAVATVSVLLAYRYWGRRAALVVAPFAACLVGIVFVGVTVRIYHYATDAVGGLAMGVATTMVAMLVVDAVERRMATMKSRRVPEHADRSG